ncbi:hypothetical protein EYC80_010024 [Monilinia laxa]|uniref:Uncharacterized protein n=1 Tax=Monilinia laxa TaxID=61186 RepID=A0A5N6JRE7_MONLA|nr:hypothetical protein EYC80_010024 [Monilinia laxa]
MNVNVLHAFLFDPSQLSYESENLTLRLHCQSNENNSKMSIKAWNSSRSYAVKSNPPPEYHNVHVKEGSNATRIQEWKNRRWCYQIHVKSMVFNLDGKKGI